MYVDFRTATDRLGKPVTHQEMADGCGTSISAIRQGRLDDGFDGYRTPPPGWRGCIANLARKRAGDLIALAEQLEKDLSSL